MPVCEYCGKKWVDLCGFRYNGANLWLCKRCEEYMWFSYVYSPNRIKYLEKKERKK